MWLIQIRADLIILLPSIMRPSSAATCMANDGPQDMIKSL